MAMDFWAAQKRARSRTTLYVTLFILLTTVTAVLIEIAMRIFAQDSYDTSFPWVGSLFALVTFLVAWFQYINFKSNGGSYVATSLGAIQVSPNTTNPKERQLLNIVEEMAVAASLPIPPVFILSANEINAFAAGLSPNDAAITVTVGTLNKLNRDELQGVVAHEFGHVYNGDMKISMRLAAMVIGFFIILYIGLRILQFSRFSSRDDNGKKGNPVAIAALLFIIGGAFTWFMGSILKSAVSREREYLADACAVQFTRNPDGIANALRKIAKSTASSDMPKNGDAYSHMYFEDRTALSWLFATHPSIEKRIEAIQGRLYIPEDLNIPPEKPQNNT